jgi:hypothetical protein
LRIASLCKTIGRKNRAKLVIFDDKSGLKSKPGEALLYITKSTTTNQKVLRGENQRTGP